MKKLLALILLTGGVVSSPGSAQNNDAVSQDQLGRVTVRGVVQSGDLMPGGKRQKRVTTTLTLNVDSGGCTKAEDFALGVTQNENVQEVTVTRLRPDGCEAYFPDGKDVDLVTTQLLPHKAIVVLNPLRVTEHFTH